MAKISQLKTADRVEIFRHLAVNELDEIKVEVLDKIATDQYQAFQEFCEKVYAERATIDNISCHISRGKLHFDVEYKK